MRSAVGEVSIYGGLVDTVRSELDSSGHGDAEILALDLIDRRANSVRNPYDNQVRELKSSCTGVRFRLRASPCRVAPARLALL